MDFSGAVKRAWSYSLDAKRFGTMLAMLLIAFVIAVAPIFFIYKTFSLGLLNVFTLIQSFALLLVGIIIGVLILLYATLLFTHNYANKKSLGASARFALSNYPKFLAVVIVSGLVSWIVGFVPFIGIILSIAAGLIFFFVQQEVGARKSSFSDSLTNSYRLFMNNKLDTIIAMIITAVLSLIIIIIFAIPILAVLFGALGAALTGGSFTAVLAANIGALVVSAVMLVIGLAFATLFSNSIKTDIFMQMIKNRKR